MEKVCKWCDMPIKEGKECTFCWELRHRMEIKPALAQKILDGVNNEK